MSREKQDETIAKFLRDVADYIVVRPKPLAIRPTCKPGHKVVTAICDTCGTLTGFTFTEGYSCFPDSGYWTVCSACGTYRMFYRIHDGRIVRTNYHPKHGEKECAHHWKHPEKE